MTSTFKDVGCNGNSPPSISKIYMGEGAKHSGWIPLPHDVIENRITPLINHDTVDDDTDVVKVNATKDVAFSGWIDVSYGTVVKDIEPVIDEYRFDAESEHTFVKEVRDVVKSISWRNTPHADFSLHDYIQAQIVSKTDVSDAFVVPEIALPSRSKKRGGNKRIDVGIYVDDELESAIEIDGTVKSNSIDKLQSLPSNVERIIVSKAKAQSRIEKRCEKYLPSTFQHIDAEVHKII